MEDKVILYCKWSIKDQGVKLARGWRLFGKTGAYCKLTVSANAKSFYLTNLRFRRVFSVFLFYQCFLYILFAVVFIYITHNSSLDALTSFINGLTMFLHVSIVCLMTKNPDMPQLPCQLDSLIF